MSNKLVILILNAHFATEIYLYNSAISQCKNVEKINDCKCKNKNNVSH